MKNNSKTYKIVVSGLMLALGILLPLLTAHGFGLPGTVLLPMHIPVFLAGLLCGPVYGLICGIIIPAASTLLTGMPAVFPMLPIMLGELASYGFVSGMIYKAYNKSAYPALLGAMLCGRIVYGVIFAILMSFNGGMKALSVFAAITTGLPGIAVQLILIPVLVKLINRYYRGNHVEEKAMEILKNQGSALENGSSCLVIKNKEIVYSGEGRGVKPLIELYENHPELLSDAFVIDKIIGRAAAVILILGGAKKAFGEVMSDGAIELLQKNGITAQFDKRVDTILNRAGNGMCPLEKASLDCEDYAQCYENIKKTISELMTKAPTVLAEQN
ncbi:MAG: ECF transporter S component [Oscillospiraceae bacterium]